MDCGIPFCHQGCPLGNLIPDWNDLVYRDRWQAAIDRLHATNNFPEFTGKLCPAPCEGSCVLGINDDPVTIKSIEASIIDRAWDEGWVTPRPPATRTWKKVAVVGSGPAGLAAADQLNRAGHSVTVFEKSDRIGGLLRYGIPEFKMEKRFLDRRLAVMEAEGVVFRPGVNVGVDVPVGAAARRLRRDAAGRRRRPAARSAGAGPRADGHPLRDGLPDAAEPAQRRRRDSATPTSSPPKDKHVIIIGGGDTGADCLGTAHRQGARVGAPARAAAACRRRARAADNPWPQWPHIFRVSSGARRGRRAAVLRCRRSGSPATPTGTCSALHAVQVEMVQRGRPHCSSSRCPAASSRSPPTWCCWRWASSGPEKGALLDELGVTHDRPRQRRRATRAG